VTQESENKYKWATMGDLNAFFGLMLDNVTNLVILTGLLHGIFKYPLEMIFTRMIPGTAFGVFVGNIIYTIMAVKLAKRTNNPNVTAMPLGLDTPSTIGIAVAVLGPVYLASGDAQLTWHVGMAVLVMMGVVKILMSFIGSWVQKVVPQAGLLGSLAGIGLALLCFLPLVDIFKMPVVGMLALGIILYTIVARLELPGKIPGVFAAVAVGTIIYYIAGPMGWLGTEFKSPEIALRLAFPMPTLGFLNGLNAAIPYLPIAIPFGLLTIVGGINVTESARVAGDEYKTRDILLTEAFATLIAGVCGGVAQSTPYIGHPAYKNMGARAAYTLATGIFIGLGGILGYISFIVDIIPVQAVAPILIFVGLEIISQAFHICPKRHTAAVAFSFLPIVANLVLIQIKTLLPACGVFDFHKLPHETAYSVEVITALGNGFILTAMLWGAILALMIDKKLKHSIIYVLISALFTFFGIIHSVKFSGDMYLPWKINSSLPYSFTTGYLVFAVFLILMLLFAPKPTTDDAG
jgi:adenine/guanine/hypoxanthine permease